MKASKFLLAVALALPCLALAQTPEAPPEPAAAGPAVEAPAPPAPIVTEPLQISGANGGFMEEGAAAGGYTFLTRTVAGSTDLFTQKRTQVSVDFRMLGAALPAPIQGKCTIRVEGRSFLGFEWDHRIAQMYTCTVAGQPDTNTAIEVQLPAFKPAAFSIGGISIGDDGDNAKQRAVLRVKMLFDGHAYEALPSGFATPGFLGDRTVTGFAITRDGQPVGGIAFDMRNRERGVISAPVADDDGRRAVIFMAFNLLKLPDFYVEKVREQFLFQ